MPDVHAVESAQREYGFVYGVEILYGIENLQNDVFDANVREFAWRANPCGFLMRLNLGMFGKRIHKQLG